MTRRAVEPVKEWWVDDCGKWRDHHCLGPSPFSTSDNEDARYDQESAAFFFLGMANIIAGPHRIRIRWSVPHVDAESLGTVLEYLDALIDPPRIVLEYYFGGWERKIFSDKILAIESLEMAMRYRHAVPLSKPFVRRMAVDDDLVCSSIRTVFEAWERSRGRISFSHENVLSPMNERFLISGPREDDGEMIYRYLGSQAALTRFKGADWAAKVRGKSHGRGVVDGSRADIITGPYEEVLKSKQPRFDHVRACITRSDKIPEWVTYQRLLLPANGDNGEPLVLCMVAKTPLIDIPMQINMPSNISPSIPPSIPPRGQTA